MRFLHPSSRRRRALAALGTVAGLASTWHVAQPADQPVIATPARESAPTSEVRAARAPTTTTSAKAPRPTTDPSVVHQLQQIVAQASALQVGVAVTESNGAPLVEHNADVPLVPASTVKTATAAAALLRFSGEHRYRTSVAGTAPVDPAGVVVGDLVLVGGGDPVLATPNYVSARPERPHTPLTALADTVVASGVRHVTGGVIGDSSVFVDDPTPEGWPDSYLAEGNGAQITGLTVDGGRVLWRDGRGLQSAVAGNPSVEAAQALKRMLQARGVRVDGGVAVTTQRVAGTAAIASVDSPPLWHILRYMMQTSDNHIADTVFRTIGVAAKDATWEGSAKEVRRLLESAGVEMSDASLPDGSGLSRAARLSAKTLVSIDAALHRTPHRDPWIHLPAVVGEAGTLRNRLDETVADGRVKGKTGTLRDVRALAGVVEGSNAPRYRFAVIGNGLDDAGTQAVRKLQDDLALVLAQAAAACEPACPR